MIKRIGFLLLLVGAAFACDPASEEAAAPAEEAAAPTASAPVQPEADAVLEGAPGPVTIRLNEEEIRERYRGAGREELLAAHGEPLSRDEVQFKDRMERWTWPAELDHGGQRVDRVSFLLRYGKYVSAYGFPGLVPPGRRERVMMEDELVTAAHRRPIQAALEALGEPDWIHLRADGKPALEYHMWVQRGTTQFSAVILYPGENGIVSGYSFEQTGKREVDG